MINYADYFGQIEYVDDNNTDFDIHSILHDIENKNRAVNLVCGQVQSGKTKFILDTISLAFEQYDYKIVIFLCGTTNNLKAQSVLRAYNEITVEIVDKLDEFEDKNSSINKNKKLLFSILKSVSNLEQMYNFLSSYGLWNKKILLIDDECDYASVNTSDKYNPTRVNELITKIYNEIESGGFLQVTATPYCNILNSKSGEIDNIYPLKSPNEYTGISFFNELDDFYITNFENKFRQITGKLSLNNDDLIILYSIFQWIYQTYNFFKQHPNEKSTLLIYLSSEKSQHESYKNSVNSFIRNFRFNYEDIFRQWLMKDKEITNSQTIDAMLNLIQEVKSSNCIYVLNSDTDSNIQDINTKKMTIVIGGVMLSRGITYENLLTECFWCAAKNEVACDTLLQRCRWFGYRRKNDRYKYMNLITTNEIKDYMFEAEKLNDCLFQQSGKRLSFAKTYDKIRECESKLNIKATYEYKK